MDYGTYQDFLRDDVGLTKGSGDTDRIVGMAEIPYFSSPTLNDIDHANQVFNLDLVSGDPGTRSHASYATNEVDKNSNALDFTSVHGNDFCSENRGETAGNNLVNNSSVSNLSIEKDVNENDNRKSKAKTSSKNSSPHGSGSTEEDLYQRRKAQNRAAQRAFRERKEGKLKELSGKLKSAELEREKLERLLEELKQKNQQLDLENKLLQRQQFQPQSQSSHSINNLGEGLNGLENSAMGSVNKSPFTATSTVEETTEKLLLFKFPNTTKCDFIAGTIDWARHGRDDSSALEASKVGQSYEIDNEKVLTISAVWDYLVEFTALNGEYELDIPGIMTELRGKEMCHGFGPAYPLGVVNNIILDHVDLK